jgi:hypothetical protein
MSGHVGNSTTYMGYSSSNSFVVSLILHKGGQMSSFASHQQMLAPSLSQMQMSNMASLLWNLQENNHPLSSSLHQQQQEQQLQLCYQIMDGNATLLLATSRSKVVASHSSSAKKQPHAVPALLGTALLGTRSSSSIHLDTKHCHSLGVPEDEYALSPYQILLRQQIELFPAAMTDIATHARGRNKPISLYQVGIRCRHCKTYPHNKRSKGSGYFPFSLIGIYQAAQNMGLSHFRDGQCSSTPEHIRRQFAFCSNYKSSNVSGKKYWATAAEKKGLVDTDHGMRFIQDIC